MARRKRKPPKKLACDGKKKYPKALARAKAFYLTRTTGGFYQAYACCYGCRFPDNSKAWHIGHKRR